MSNFGDPMDIDPPSFNPGQTRKFQEFACGEEVEQGREYQPLHAGSLLSAHLCRLQKFARAGRHASASRHSTRKTRTTEVQSGGNAAKRRLVNFARNLRVTPIQRRRRTSSPPPPSSSQESGQEELTRMEGIEYTSAVYF